MSWQGPQFAPNRHCFASREGQRGLLTADAAPSYVLLRLRSVGVNNLPSPAQQALAELFGPLPELLEEVVTDAPDVMTQRFLLNLSR